MSADRTNFRRFLTYDNMTTIRALPDHISISGENQTLLYIGQELKITFLVFFLNGANHGKESGNTIKALFLRGLRDVYKRQM